MFRFTTEELHILFDSFRKNYGNVSEYFTFSDILVIEYEDKFTKTEFYATYIVGDKGFNVFTDIETAIIETIAIKYDGADTQAGKMFARMINKGRDDK
jgi:hypothetical protein